MGFILQLLEMYLRPNRNNTPFHIPMLDVAIYSYPFLCLLFPLSVSIVHTIGPLTRLPRYFLWISTYNAMKECLPARGPVHLTTSHVHLIHPCCAFP